MSVKNLSLILLILTLVILSSIAALSYRLILLQDESLELFKLERDFSNSTNSLRINSLRLNTFVQINKNFNLKPEHDCKSCFLTIQSELNKIDSLISKKIKTDVELKNVSSDFISIYQRNINYFINRITKDSKSEDSLAQSYYNFIMDETFLSNNSQISVSFEQFTNEMNSFFKELRMENHDKSEQSSQYINLLVLFELFILVFYVFVVNKNIIKPVKYLVNAANEIISGNFQYDNYKKIPNNEIGKYLTLFNKMAKHLKDSDVKSEEAKWLRLGEIRLYKEITNKNDYLSYSDAALKEIINYTESSCGSFYIRIKNADYLELVNSFSMESQDVIRIIHFADGILGEAVLKKEIQIVKNLPSNYIKISSSLGNTGARQLAILPIHYNNELIGGIEIAKFNEFTNADMDYLNLCQRVIANTFISIWNMEK